MKHTSVLPFFSPENFKNPSSSFYPSYAWVWNVEITKEGIDLQLSELYEAGVRSIYVIPEPENFRPASMKTELSPEYLSDDFFEMIKYTANKAEGLGMTMWIYDEGGFPSGGACGKVAAECPDAAAVKISKREIPLGATEKYTPSPDALCAFCDGKRVFSDFIPQHDVTVSEYFPEKYVPNPNVVGLTNRKTTETFIKLTHEKYAECVGEHFGSFIPLIFTDEPRMYLPLWNDEIEDEFRLKFGYDFLDYMPVIFDEALAENDDDKRAVINYHEICAELFVRNFMHPIREWCDMHGVAFAGHLDKDNTPEYSTKLGYGSHVYGLSEMHIPGVDTIWQQIFPNKNGSPTYEGSLFFPRVASSAATAGSGLALSESFAVYGEGITQDEMRYTVNFQFARGINVFNFMAVSYGHGNAHTLCMRPSFSSDKPGFFARADFDRSVARTEIVMQTGRRTADTLLFHPHGDVSLGGDIAEKALASYEKLGLMLEEKFIDFDITDEFMLKKARIEDGMIVIGNAKYRHLVLPECKYVPDLVRSLADRFSGIGEPLIECESDAVRASRRICDNGDLIYFIFNQSVEKITSSALLHSPDGKNIYRLHEENGHITREESENVMFDLPSGAAAIYLVTDSEIPADNYTEVCTATLGRATRKSVTSYRFDNGSVVHKDEKNDFKTDENFSGEVVYELDYAFDAKSDADGICVLSFTAPRLSAEIFIDGEKCGTCGTEPMQVFIPAEKFDTCGKISIKLSNTLANDIVKRSDEIAEQYGNVVNMNYHGRSVVFEKNAPVMSEPDNIKLVLTKNSCNRDENVL